MEVYCSVAGKTETSHSDRGATVNTKRAMTATCPAMTQGKHSVPYDMSHSASGWATTRPRAEAAMYPWSGNFGFRSTT